MKKIMILGASILQLPAINKAKDMGLSVVAVDMNPEAVGFHVPGIEKEVISTIDIPAVVEAAKRHKIDGVMTLASDMPMRTVAAVAKEMHLVGISSDTAVKATDKAAMRNALKQYGVPIPAFYSVSSESEFQEAIQKLRSRGCQCIAKPADNSGSRGIDLIDDYSKENLKKVYAYSKKFSRNGLVMVEEYMTGPEVSVETLTVDGKCHVIQITDKLTTGAPYFVEMGHSQPSGFSDEVKEKIAAVAVAANHAVGITDGPSHTEIKVTEQGPKIVEIGARLGGDNITTDLVPLSTGVDMVECCIRLALGEKPEIKKKFSKGSAVRYIDGEAGTIQQICGAEEALKIKGVKRVEFTKEKGCLISEVKSSTDRTGFVIAQADTAQEACEICEAAAEKIIVMVE